MLNQQELRKVIDMTHVKETLPSPAEGQKQRESVEAQATQTSAVRWAWSSPTTEFDWMDTHQPFVPPESL